MPRRGEFLDSAGYAEYDPEMDDHYDPVGWNSGGAPDVRAKRDANWSSPDTEYVYPLDEAHARGDANLTYEPEAALGHPAHMRAWLSENGYPNLSARGRLPKRGVLAYREEHGL